MTPRKWERILITEEMQNYIKEIIAKYPDLGYSNQHEFGRSALRWFIKKIEKETGFSPLAEESDPSERDDDES